MSKARADSRTVDLLLWAEIDDARAELEHAETARRAAQRKWVYAPMGTKTDRFKTLLDATNAAIRAAGTLRRLEREAGI